jgi:hypothetical protein
VDNKFEIMFNDDEYFLNLEKEKRDKAIEVGNNLIAYLKNSFTGKISPNREIVDIYITAFHKDVIDKDEMITLVLGYIKKIEE